MKCDKCNQETDDTIKDLLTLDWEEVAFADKGDTLLTREWNLVEVIDITGTSSRYDSYGYVIPDEYFVVLEAGGRLFKRTGRRASYGYVDWNDDLREVKRAERQITVYDYI